ncbi:MAG: hypothetical protein ACERLG_04110 [Sedimentibacter sp.]
MITLKRILFIVICFFMLSYQAYGFAKVVELPDKTDIEINIEKEYGLNIIISGEDEQLYYKECLISLEQNLRKFPKGAIREITDYYAKKGIRTNVIINTTENIMDLFSEYVIDGDSANIYINALQSSLYSDYCVASEENLGHELGRFIADYIYEIYGYEKLKSEFIYLNIGYTYGQWGNGYSNVFINKHSAMSFNDEVANLIWYTGVHPEILREIGAGEKEIIHEKVEFLAGVFDKCFDSITLGSKLWLDAVPQMPDKWAVESIDFMKSASLIPVEYEGIYEAYITREKFYSLALNVMQRKLGKEGFDRSFNINLQEQYVTIDPIKGKMHICDGTSDLFSDMLLYNNKEINYEAYQIGLINSEIVELPQDGYMTRLEIAKLINYIGNELGMDISDYHEVYYDDIYSVKLLDRPFVYFASNKGILKGYGSSFKPYDYLTFQEAYVILSRLYNIL